MFEFTGRHETQNKNNPLLPIGRQPHLNPGSGLGFDYQYRQIIKKIASLVPVYLFSNLTEVVLFLLQIFQFVYKSQLVLRPESSSFPMWQDLPAPLIASIYIFNVTNAEQVIQ